MESWTVIQGSKESLAQRTVIGNKHPDAICIHTEAARKSKLTINGSFTPAPLTINGERVGSNHVPLFAVLSEQAAL